MPAPLDSSQCGSGTWFSIKAALVLSVVAACGSVSATQDSGNGNGDGDGGGVTVTVAVQGGLDGPRRVDARWARLSGNVQRELRVGNIGDADGCPGYRRRVLMSDAELTMSAQLTLEFTDEGAPLQDADLDAFESQVGVRLPAEYRAFLKSHNGGRVEPRTLRMRPSSQIQYFVTIGPPIDAVYYWDMFKNTKRMPPEHIPIARCDGGDLLTMVTEGPTRGQIFYWDHEEEGDETYTYDNLYLVAASLDDLLAGLFDDELM